MITPILRVHDVDLSLAFYTQVLGFEGSGGLPGLDGRTVYAEAAFGDARVMFTRRCGAAPGSASLLVTGIELYLTLPDTADIGALYRFIRAREVYIAAEMHEEFCGDCAFTILDLDGNRLTFAQPIRRAVDAPLPVFEQIA